MKTRLAKAVTAAGAGLAALVVGMSSASAAPTFTVTAGTAPTGTSVAIKGVTSGASPQVTFVDTTSGTTLNCVAATAPGVAKTGTGKPGAGIATINGAKTTWTTCTGPLGLQFTVTGIGSWKLNASSGTAAKVTGAIAGVKAHVNGGSTCTFDVAGSVAATYTNATQILATPGTTSQLKISNVVGGCFGAVNSGDVASFKASYKITATVAKYNPLKVTSP